MRGIVGANPCVRPVKYNPDIHHRRSIRLRNYDYAQAGAYFVTICLQYRECLFGEITVPPVGADPCVCPGFSPEIRLTDAVPNGADNMGPNPESLSRCRYRCLRGHAKSYPRDCGIDQSCRRDGFLCPSVIHDLGMLQQGRHGGLPLRNRCHCRMWCNDINL
ncbi:hypothetical protein GKODMF_14580 [Candidatus Electrothrix gigas]